MVPGWATQLWRCLPRPRTACSVHGAPHLRELGQQFGLAGLLLHGARARAGARAWKLPGQHEYVALGLLWTLPSLSRERSDLSHL